ncbi:cytochrome c biogenesis protein ResB [Pelotalea chapellei]|uniref:Cytochrome c biogenesis protein ResB n=1 Tax=Pelotalea chapellei TaxID=44671 RepID=A0ABS5UA36_9BACT|nr:cytochrome c biogenesis protein ResB [Pelotalea chapellei]MBT1072558.1 cytochrome c biogenesis protein ResB [Pelotalea chapellei]
MAPTQRSFAQSIWEFFCSLKLTIFLLISLALTSIIGTILPQGQLPPEYVAQISPTKLQIYSKLGFFDMYHSWWFITLLYVFSLNLVCCSIKRLPHVLKFINEPLLVLGDSQRNTFSLKQEIPVSGAPAAGRDTLVEFLKREVASPVVTEHSGEYHLFAQKNAWSRLGVYVVHFSILVIFIGAIIGSLFGYKGYVSIVEGSAVSAVEARNGQQISLGFEVRCEKFAVDFYPTGAPKEFRSLLTILENGQPVPGYKDVKVIVNHPLSYKGITFYQSSYGQANEGSEHYLTVNQRNGAGAERFAIHEGESVTFKDGTTLKLLETAQDVRPFMPDFTGAAARVEVTYKNKSPQTFIVFKDYPEVNAQRGDALIFGYQGTNARMYTGLQVARDPGVWVVWLGCTLMILGLYIAFFMSHKRVWIVLSKGHARMYGNASKNQAAFAMQFEDLADKLKNQKI